MLKKKNSPKLLQKGAKSIGLRFSRTDRHDVLIIPLEALLFPSGSGNSSPVSTTTTATSNDLETSEIKGNGSTDGSSDGIDSSKIAGIVVGVMAAFFIAVFATYKVAYARGAKATAMMYENEKESSKEGPQMVDEAIS